MAKFTKRIFIQFLYILIDVFFIGLSFYLAAQLRHSTVPFDITPENIFISSKNSFRYLFYFWTLVIVILNHSSRLYETKREIVETTEIWVVAKSVILSALITIVAIYLVKILNFPRTILFTTSVFMFFFLSLWRILKRKFVSYLVAQGFNNFNTLVIGHGNVGQMLAEEIQKRPGLGLNVVGHLVDPENSETESSDIVVLGALKDFLTIARREFVNIIYITCHLKEQSFLDLLEQAKSLGVAIRVVPQGFELMSGQFANHNIGLIPILEYTDTQRLRQQAGKRFFDFVLALGGFIFLVPVFFIISIMIKCDSQGPIFYASKRYGRDGRFFNMLKFRSMVEDAEQTLEKIKDQNEVDGPIFKIKKDPRITKVGKFLRKYSLDELPQLINVIIGDMSLVGPRPLPIPQVEKEDFRQLQRLEVRPGITGLWQIRGRSDISFARLVKWDIWYINNWSFWLDLNILFLTIPAVFKGRGAY